MAKKRQKNQQSAPAERSQSTRVVTYEITDEPILDEAYRRLPKNVKEQLHQLYELAQRRPKAAIPDLLALREKYPKVHQISNYLAAAYNGVGEVAIARQLIEENYRRHPDYLFARVHYAELCLHAGNYAEIPEIFEHKFDLKLLYPARRRFHVSEVMAFFGLLGNYFLATGDRTRAEQIYQMLYQLQPKHTYTRLLHRKLYPSLLRRLILRLTGKKENYT